MGSMIGSGIFIVSADVARQVGSPGLLIVCWLLGGAPHHHRGAQLRRTRRRHAARRRSVRLSARSLRPPLGFPLWLDPLRRHPDRNHRRRRRGFRQILGRLLPVHLRVQLPHRFGQDRGHHPATARHRRHPDPERRQHARHPDRRHGAEHLHLRESRFAARTSRLRFHAGPQSAGDRSQLRTLLERSNAGVGPRSRWSEPPWLARSSRPMPGTT